MSTVVAAPPGRRRRWRYAIWIAVLALFLFFVALGFYLNSNSFRQSVRNKVVTQLERMTGGRVELQSLDWKWTTLQCDARGLTIHGLESPAEAPYAHADDISVGIRIKSLLSRQIALSNVVVDHLVIHIIVYPDGSTNQPAPKRQLAAAGASPERLFDLGINHLEVRDGTLLLNQEQIPFAIMGDRMSAAISYSPHDNGYEASLSMSLASARWRNLPAQRGDIDMQILLRTTDAEIRSLRIAMPGSTLQATGTLKNYNHPEVHMRYTASVDLADAGKLARVVALRGGRADLAGNLDYRNDQYSTSGTLQVTKLEWRDPTVHAADVAGSSAYYLDPDRLSLTRLSARIFGGLVAGNVQIAGWNSSSASKAVPAKGASVLQLSGLEINRVVAAATEPDLPLRRLDLVGRISGTLKSARPGTPSPRSIWQSLRPKLPHHSKSH
jgi:translocation and assembly module TamB